MSATALPLRASRPSPRSEERPMAFTAGEFIRGALAAWGLFVLISPFALAGYGTVGSLILTGRSDAEWIVPTLLISPMILVPYSLGALVIGAPLALLLGLSLRRIRRRAVHIACFAGLGALVGAAATIVFTWMSTIPPSGVTVIHHVPPPTLGERILGNGPMILLFAAVTALTVALGWLITATRALRADADRRGSAEDDSAPDSSAGVQ